MQKLSLQMYCLHSSNLQLLIKKCKLVQTAQWGQKNATKTNDYLPPLPISWVKKWNGFNGLSPPFPTFNPPLSVAGEESNLGGFRFPFNTIPSAGITAFQEQDKSGVSCFPIRTSRPCETLGRHRMLCWRTLPRSRSHLRDASCDLKTLALSHTAWHNTQTATHLLALSMSSSSSSPRPPSRLLRGLLTCGWRGIDTVALVVNTCLFHTLKNKKTLIW